MKALIIDDSKLTRHLVSDVLKQSTSVEKILEANSGVNGLKILDDTPSIDLVLLDINMPDMNGIETLQNIRKKPSLINTRVIMISSESHKDEIEQCKVYGADDYLVKPFTSATLAQTLSKHINKE